ncbi:MULTISPECIES: protein-disulfide reductase DsbD [unclassified Massilia]|uniref:protein-disulfide reductase DsbD n=1 Tax=unclassified Massilia TaxID=2609279 RepID=UPI00177FA82B|nr:MULTISPECIES: protein-disulfide reductase DsbD [unclassified Massilia]MBD8533159.1 protein-disulfide reductase DsbD [Massilia sp. CFBP 13647]MBD8676614.1 protein-disulfide reductase DsbD [Massilia sp. CFBP 13721]
MFIARFREAPARLLAALTLLFVATMLLAAPGRAQDFLDPAVAFKFSARMDGERTAVVTYDIAPGYYMYRERFKFTATGATLGEPQIPPGKVKYDQTFEKDVETYHGAVTIRIPVDSGTAFTLNATSQGCADAGLCYPPQEHSARLTAAGGSAAQASIPFGAGVEQSSSIALSSTPVSEGPASKPAAPLSSAAPAAAAPEPAAAPAEPQVASAESTAAPATASAPSDMASIDAILQGGRLLAIVPAFALLGLGLAFTPCVLPMVPILSSIIVGEGGKTRRARGLLLSVTYSLGMAIVYTALGVAAGLIGEGLAAALQNPWVLGAFALLIVAMALSMFGFYELQVPAALQSRLAGASNRQASGKLAGVFAMGAISALIVGPCVAAPLAGALVYISQTRDVLVGGAALFSMAVGMSIPLLLVGVSAGSLLPRAGAWMEGVKRFFGVLMLGMALWLVAPVLPALVQMVLWAALLLGYGAWLLTRKGHWSRYAFGAAFAILGGMQLVGVASGGRDPLAPLAHLTGNAQHGLTFKRVKTVADLDAALAELATSGGKTAMLDFYADWCVSCKEMEKFTFVDPAVQAKLANTVLLQVDVTANDADDKAMLKRFGLFGPPGIIFFDRTGREIADSRVIGYQNAGKFLNSLQKVE